VRVSEAEKNICDEIFIKTIIKQEIFKMPAQGLNTSQADTRMVGHELTIWQYFQEASDGRERYCWELVRE
jgi:hypothetical protein